MKTPRMVVVVALVAAMLLCAAVAHAMPTEGRQQQEKEGEQSRQ